MDGEKELVAAAEWVSPLAGGPDGKKKDEKENVKAKGKEEARDDKEMWTGFKHKIYEPTTSAPDASKSWKEWNLERKHVEENLQTAIKASTAHYKDPLKVIKEEDEDQLYGGDGPIHGIPGGTLFWPLEANIPPAVLEQKRRSGNVKSLALPVVPEQTENVGLGLQVPGQYSTSAAVGVSPRGPRWNEKTQTWEDYLSPLPPLAKPLSEPEQQHAISSPSDAGLWQKEKGEGEKTPRASMLQHSKPLLGITSIEEEEPVLRDVRYQPLRHISFSSMKSQVAENYTSSPSQQINQSGIENMDPRADEAHKRKTYSPSNYEASPAPTVGSKFLSYYGHPAAKPVIQGSMSGVGQDVPESLIEEAKAENLGEKGQKAYLAISGHRVRNDDKDEDWDEEITPTNPIFTTHNTRPMSKSSVPTHHPVGGDKAASKTAPPPSAASYHDSPYPGPASLNPPSAHKGTPATAFVTQQATTSFLPPWAVAASTSHRSPYSTEASPSTVAGKSPASAILDLYGSLTPPDTARTYATEGTIFTPSPDFPSSASSNHPNTSREDVFPVPPARPAPPVPVPVPVSVPVPATIVKTNPNPPPHITGNPTPPTTAGSSTSIRTFSASPLNKPKKPIIPKSIPRGLGIGIAGLAGPEPAMSLEEAIATRKRRDEEARLEREEEELAKQEYIEWMADLKRKEDREAEGKGDDEEREEEEEELEYLQPTVFEGFPEYHRRQAERARLEAEQREREEAERRAREVVLPAQAFEGFGDAEKPKVKTEKKKIVGDGNPELFVRDGDEEDEGVDEEEKKWLEMVEKMQKAGLGDEK